MPETNSPPPEGDPTTRYILELSEALSATGDRPPIAHSIAGMVTIIEQDFAPPRCPRPLVGRLIPAGQRVAPGMADYFDVIERVNTSPLLQVMDEALSRLVPGSVPYESINRPALARDVIAGVLDRYDLVPIADDTNEAGVMCKLGTSTLQIHHIGGGIRVTTWSNRLTPQERTTVDREYDRVMRQALGLVQLHQFAHGEIPPFAEPVRPAIEANRERIDTSFADHVRQVRTFTDAAGYRRFRLYGDVRNCVPIAVHLAAGSRSETDPMLAVGSVGSGSLTVTSPGSFMALHDSSLRWNVGEDGGIRVTDEP